MASPQPFYAPNPMLELLLRVGLVFTEHIEESNRDSNHDFYIYPTTVRNWRWESSLRIFKDDTWYYKEYDGVEARWGTVRGEEDLRRLLEGTRLANRLFAYKLSLLDKVLGS